MDNRREFAGSSAESKDNMEAVMEPLGRYPYIITLLVALIILNPRKDKKRWQEVLRFILQLSSIISEYTCYLLIYKSIVVLL